MRRLNHLFFKRALARQLRTQKRERGYLSYDDITSVLILFESDYDERNEAVRHIMKQLAADGKKVEALGYVAKQQIESPTVLNFSIHGLKSIGCFRKPKKAALDAIQQKRFDVLIDLSVRPTLELQYFLMMAKAPCKIGRYQTEYPLLDFMIQVSANKVVKRVHGESFDEEVMHLFEQILYYLKSIRTIK